MFKRSYRAATERAGKPNKVTKRSFGEDCKRSFGQDSKRHLADQLRAHLLRGSPETSPSLGEGSPKLNDGVVTIVVGKEQRLFAGHESVLGRSSWFAREITSDHCMGDLFSTGQRTVYLPDDDPQVFAAVLEFLYRGDYTPYLLHDKRRGTWSLGEDPTTTQSSQQRQQRGDAASTPSVIIPEKKPVGGFGDVATIFHSGVGEHVLRETAVYCAAQRLGVPDLQRLALKKQGMQTGIDVGTILRSARFAYANTPDGDSKLRAHYLALIIRSRRVFKQSGTMQAEMEKGGTQMFFDLFVALCHHIDDVGADGGSSSGGPSPRLFG